MYMHDPFIHRFTTSGFNRVRRAWYPVGDRFEIWRRSPFGVRVFVREHNMGDWFDIRFSQAIVRPITVISRNITEDYIGDPKSVTASPCTCTHAKLATSGGIFRVGLASVHTMHCFG